MKIIGGHDYYDGAMGYGIDKTVVFARQKHEREELPKRELPSCHMRHELLDIGDRFGDRIEIDSVNLYFCGRLYLGIRLYLSNYRDYDKIDKVCWSYDEVLEQLPDHKDNKRFVNALREYFDQQRDPERHLGLLAGKGITLALLHQRRRWSEANWRIDGDFLGSYEFYRVKDAFSAFQEIYAWVSGVLPGASNKMVQIVDEKIRISKRGFDPVTSFRKEPTKHKKGKKT